MRPPKYAHLTHQDRSEREVIEKIAVTDTARAKYTRADRPGEKSHDTMYSPRELCVLVRDRLGELYYDTEEDAYNLVTSDSLVVVFIQNGSELVVVTQRHKHGDEYGHDKEYRLVKLPPWEVSEFVRFE